MRARRYGHDFRGRGVTDPVLPLAFGVAASLCTLLGGVLALRYANRITLVLGLTAGVVLGVAFFDLIPEALDMGAKTYGSRTVLAFSAIGLVAYMLLTRSLRTPLEPGGGWQNHLGPASLTLHSLLDGVGIGFAFQISPQIGWMIAVAVLTHDIADGVNTVSLSLTTNHHAAARNWLVANGAAPLIGVILGLLVVIPPMMLAPLLALFAGVFVYIGACELLPRSHARDPRLRTSIASLVGIGIMFAVTVAAK